MNQGVGNNPHPPYNIIMRNYIGYREFEENGFIYHSDIDHAGQLECDKDILTEKGILEDWDAPTEDNFLMYYPEWQDDQNIKDYPEDYQEEKDAFMNRYTYYISHCFRVTTPDGGELSYGDETPHGTIGSEEFVLWYNELPSDVLSYSQTNGWCDG